MQSKTDYIIALTPGLSGLALLGVALLDIALFQDGAITARQAIGHELLFFFLGLFSTLMVIVRTGFWLKQKRYKMALLGAASVLAYFGFFALAAQQGAAILYAT